MNSSYDSLTEKVGAVYQNTKAKWAFHALADPDSGSDSNTFCNDTYPLSITEAPQHVR